MLVRLLAFLYEYSATNPDILYDDEGLKKLFQELAQKFMDIRKRIVKFEHQRLTQMVAIPTTSVLLK